MQHPTLEALARLVDEAPEPVERAHLAACPECRAELEALVEQRRALAGLPELAPGPDQWPELRARLRREGMLRKRAAWSPAYQRAAAAVVLFLAGGWLGWAVRGPAGPAGDPGPAPTTFAAGDAVGPGARAASDDLVRTSPAGEPAGDATGEVFMAALDRYMASSEVRPADPAARLAVLDHIVMTTAEALHAAPTDPIITGYHLSALAQRDAVLRRLAADSRQPIF
jgi:hypothetical protein